MACLDQLPNETILQIIQYLPQLALYHFTLVNKRFYIAANPSLWHTPTEHSKTTGRRLLHSLTIAQHPVGQLIRTISFRHFEWWTDDNLLRLLRHTSHLETFTLMGASDTDLKPFPALCPHLTTLKLRPYYMTKAIMDALGQHCHQLTELTLLGPGVIVQSSRFFAPLITCRASLKKLEVTGFKLRMDVATRGLGTLFLDLAALTELTHLVLREYSRMPDLFDGTRCAKVLPISMWPNLVELELNPCPQLDNAWWAAWIKAHPHLTSLSLAGIPLSASRLRQQQQHHDDDDNGDYRGGGINDRALDAITIYLPDIQRLGVPYHNRLTHHGIVKLLSHCRSLIHLDVSNCGIKMADLYAAFQLDDGGGGGGGGDGIVTDAGGIYLKCLNEMAIKKIQRQWTS